MIKLRLLTYRSKFLEPLLKSLLITEQDLYKKALNYCHNLSLNKRVIGLINCPIDKRLLNEKSLGVTEFLANKCQIKKNSEVMLITNEKFSVSITTHVDLKKYQIRLVKK